MLAKLGSGHMKPNQQTVIRNRAVQQFLSGFKFTKIRGLGGKLGDQISSAFDTDTVTDLLVVPIEQLKQKLGDETGTWVHQTIRGIDSSEVNARTQIKSMLSAKSFRPSINTAEQTKRWLRIFAADIYSRLVEEGVLENKRRPKTISLHHRTGGHTRSRQASIPKGKKLDETALFELATVLMDQIILEGTVWPCINLSLSVGGFEDGISGNMGIGNFLIKGEDAKAHRSGPQEANSVSRDQERQGKRRRVESPRGIGKFFVQTGHAAHDEEFGAQKWSEPDSDLDTGRDGVGKFAREADEATEKQDVDNMPSGPSALHQQRITDFVCKRCQLGLPSADALLSHQDWHFAKDLQDEERRQPSHGDGQAAIGGSKKASQHSRHRTGQGKTEKGQSKLAFG
jgi:DNA polymerase eta